MSTQTILIISKVIREIISSRINVGLRYFIVLENAWTLWFLLGKHKNKYLLNTPLHPTPPPPTNTQTRIQYIYVHLFMFWLEISNDTKSIVLGFNTLAQPLINYRLHIFILLRYIVYYLQKIYSSSHALCSIMVESSPTTAWVINPRMCNKIYLLRVPFFNH